MAPSTKQENLTAANPVPMPSFMSPDQVAHYLSELRSYRPPRPTGARPLTTSQQSCPQSSERSLLRTRENGPASTTELSADPLSHIDPSTSEKLTAKGCEPALSLIDRDSRQTQEKSLPKTYEIPYYERGQRWMEKQEAHSLSRALQEQDSRSNARLYSAAQQEAANLIWKHQNPDAAYPNPDFDFRQHLRKGSHARSQSIGPFQELFVRKRASIDSVHRNLGGSRRVSSGSSSAASTQSSNQSKSLGERALSGISLSARRSRRLKGATLNDQYPLNNSEATALNPFSNPDDRIYEEPEDCEEAAANTFRGENPSHLRIRARNTSYGKTLPQPVPLACSKPFPKEMSNSLSTTQYKNGIEVRSKDIRAATSMRFKERSTKLPHPSIVSDLPNRPIVSFETNYVNRTETQAGFNNQDATCNDFPTPGSRVAPNRDGHVIESGNIPASFSFANVPTISLSAAGNQAVLPTISIEGCDAELPKDNQSDALQCLHPSKPRRFSETPHVQAHTSPIQFFQRTGAQCASCALKIEGRVVTAAGERFHPSCFACYQCKELLECVAFYPEPEKARSERLLRYANLYSDAHAEIGSESDQESGDPSLRFYCHLDFHERFSPRCRNCKTPIEGKVIIACGGEWHEGHFFCAECGDPFDQHTPFIEKDGYAWCVPCHCRRFSGKCAGCRKPILDLVIQALGKEWHEECFCCRQCGCQFPNGQFFTSLDNAVPICMGCETLRLKS